MTSDEISLKDEHGASDRGGADRRADRRSHGGATADVALVTAHAHSERPGCCLACKAELAALVARVERLEARARPALCVGCGRAHAECDGSALGCWRAKERLDTPGEGA